MLGPTPMPSSTDHLDHALIALGRRDHAGALAALLDAWRSVRAPALAEAVDLLSARIALPAIKAKRAADFRQVWLDVAAKGREADVPRLMAGLPRRPFSMVQEPEGFVSAGGARPTCLVDGAAPRLDPQRPTEATRRALCGRRPRSDRDGPSQVDPARRAGVSGRPKATGSPVARVALSLEGCGGASVFDAPASRSMRARLRHALLRVPPRDHLFADRRGVPELRRQRRRPQLPRQLRPRRRLHAGLGEFAVCEWLATLELRCPRVGKAGFEWRNRRRCSPRSWEPRRHPAASRRAAPGTNTRSRPPPMHSAASTRSRGDPTPEAPSAREGFGGKPWLRSTSHGA
jgi:hypothetical protein